MVINGGRGRRQGWQGWVRERKARPTSTQRSPQPQAGPSVMLDGVQSGARQGAVQYNLLSDRSDRAGRGHHSDPAGANVPLGNAWLGGRREVNRCKHRYNERLHKTTTKCPKAIGLARRPERIFLNRRIASAAYIGTTSVSSSQKEMFRASGYAGCAAVTGAVAHRVTGQRGFPRDQMATRRLVGRGETDITTQNQTTGTIKPKLVWHPRESRLQTRSLRASSWCQAPRGRSCASSSPWALTAARPP